MKSISIFIFLIIDITMCCDDFNQLKFLPPFQNLRSIQMTIGDDLNIVCCHPDGAENLSWRDKSNNEILFNTANDLFSLIDEKNRLILQINNISETKIGEYTCLNTKRALIKSIMISTKASYFIPEIVKNTLFYPTNKPIEIKCPLRTNQELKYWIFTMDGKKIKINKTSEGKDYKISKDIKIFTVIREKTSDKIKKLWCQFQQVDVNGDVKTGLYEFTWIMYDPIDVKIVLDHKGQIIENNDVRLICSFRYHDMLSVAFPSNMLMKPNFLLNNKNITKGNVVLTIRNITEDFEREYECKVSRFLSVEPFQVVEESAKFMVDIVLLPRIIKGNFVDSVAKLNEQAYLICQIISKQLAKENVYFEHFQQNSSTWKKISENDEKYSLNFTKTDLNVLTLLIKKVTWEDRGNYKCVAENAAGKDNKVGQFKVEKFPELKSNVELVYMVTEPVTIECSVSGYPLSPNEIIIELNVLNQSAPFDINVVDRRNEVDRLSVSYEVVSNEKLIEGNYYKLECFYKNTMTKLVQKKNLELRIAQKPNVPEVTIVCSGSSGIVFKYRIILQENKNKKIVKYILSYAPLKEFDSLNQKPSIVVPIKEEKDKEYMIYLLKNLVASRHYKFKWEAFNMFNLSNERILDYSTTDIKPPPTPKNLTFSTKGNMINVNVIWEDDCSYGESNAVITDIFVNMKSRNVQEKQNNNWQWIERNFTLESDKNSAQFLIYLDNPQIDYEVEVALRSSLGTSDSLKGIYKANVILRGASFYCFPRCGSSKSFSSLALVHSTLAVLFALFIQWQF